MKALIGTTLLTSASAILLAWSASAAEVASPVHGIITLTIKGHGGHGTSALSFLGLGLTQPVICQGNLESFQNNVVTDQDASWTDDQFNGPADSCYLEITSGPAAGMMSDIVDTSASSKSLTLADNLSGYLSGGETFKVRKHWTLAKLFGANNEAGLGGGSFLTADQILIYDPVSAQYTTYYYQTSGIGGTGWRSNLSATESAAGRKLDLTRGLVIRRKVAGDLNVKICGAVKTGDTYFLVHPGLNFAGNVYPVEGLTLGNSQLYTGDPATGLAPGSFVSADKVLIYNGAGYDTYYYQNQGLGGIGWRSSANANVDASATVIPGGSSIVIQRNKNKDAFYWVASQPF
ncbi:MAG: TIGR02597 family protein [Verrucomicrobiota bacterium]